VKQGFELEIKIELELHSRCLKTIESARLHQYEVVALIQRRNGAARRKLGRSSYGAGGNTLRLSSQSGTGPVGIDRSRDPLTETTSRYPDIDRA